MNMSTFNSCLLHSLPLQRGDKIGLKITSERNLVILIRGNEVGVAATNIPNGVYGFIALESRVTGVRLVVSDVQSYYVSHTFLINRCCQHAMLDFLICVEYA